MKVIFLGLPKSEEQDLIDDGISEQYVKQLSYHEGEICEATISIEVNDKDWEENYYDIRFSDGFMFYECSGYHLEEVK